MSKEYNSALQARVEQFLKEKNISQAKAAPLMGISQTALSQYRRSMYDNGDISALESKLEEFFRTQEEQEASTEKALPYRPTQDYIPTSISEDVYKLIRYHHNSRTFIISPSLRCIASGADTMSDHFHSDHISTQEAFCRFFVAAGFAYDHTGPVSRSADKLPVQSGPAPAQSR